MEKPQPSDVELEGLLEALLFVSDGPVEVERLARALEVEPERVQQTLTAWSAHSAERGLTLTRQGKRVLLTTRPEAASAIERYLGVDGGAHLSPAAIETLAIIAYLQPVTRARIDAIRGVSAAGVTRNLIARDLVQVVGNLEQAGRPELLGTTFGFLQYLGLTSLEQLPPLPQIEDLLRAAADADQADQPEPSSAPPAG